jgi:uncharacterized protein (DUF1778 family)
MTKKKATKRVINRGPRLQVTLTPETMAVLERAARLTGQRKATMAGELIEAALPALQLVEQASLLAKVDPREAQRLISNFGASAMGDLSQHQLDFDAAVTKALDGRTVKGRRQQRRARGPTS